MAVSWRVLVFTGLKIFVNDVVTSPTPYLLLSLPQIFYFYAIFQVLSFSVIYFLLAETKYKPLPPVEPDTSESEDLYWEDDPFCRPEKHPGIGKTADLVDQLFEDEGKKCGLGKGCHEMGRAPFRKMVMDLMHKNGNLYDWDIV
jgi:hypothetical protein